jgi:hypothetical protein
VNVNEKKKGDVIVAVVAHSDVPRAVLVPTFTDNTSPLARNTIYSSTTTTVNNNVIVAAGPTATTSEVQVLLIDKNIVSYDKPSNLGFFGRNTTKTFVEYKFLLCASWGFLPSSLPRLLLQPQERIRYASKIRPGRRSLAIQSSRIWDLCLCLCVVRTGHSALH